MDVVNKHYVYILYRANGAPCYVGKGHTHRWKHHQKHATNIHLKRIIAIEGILRCEKIAEKLSDEEACCLEIATIARIGRRVNGGPLVNMTDGGEGVAGWQHTPESLSRLQASWENPIVRAARLAALEATRGRKHTPESIAKLTGKIRSEEARANMRAASAARWARDADERAARKAAKKEAAKTGRKSGGQKGYVHTETARANMRAAGFKRRGQPCPEHTRKAVSRANRGRIISDETRVKLRARRRPEMNDHMKRAIAEGRILGRMARGEL